MTNNFLIIVYKEVGKEPEFKKVENKQEVLENLVGGKLDFIPYEEITIVAKKDRDNLKPNIFVNTNLLGINTSIKGTIFILCKENDNFKSVSKEQALKYRDFLIKASFKYDNFDENGRYISKRKRKKEKMRNRNQNLERGLNDTEVSTPMENTPNIELNFEETLQMILAIQTVILKFIKNHIE